MLFLVHRGLGIAPNVEHLVVKVVLHLAFLFQFELVLKERIARHRPNYLAATQVFLAELNGAQLKGVGLQPIGPFSLQIN
jgi:hypothetical protein